MYILEKIWENPYQWVKCMRIGGQNCLSNWATYEKAVKKYFKVTNYSKYSNIYCDVILFLKNKVQYLKNFLLHKYLKTYLYQTLYFIS